MARKGVLISDPSVQAMTEAQWHFEYHALKAREKRTFEQVGHLITATMRAIRATLIRVLGLDLVKTWRQLGVASKEEREALKEEMPFVPMSYLVADAERLQGWLKMDDGLSDEEADRKEAEAEAFSALLRSQVLNDVIPQKREPIKYTDTLDFKLAQQRLDEHSKAVAEREKARAAGTAPPVVVPGLRSRKLRPGEQKPKLIGKV